MIYNIASIFRKLSQHDPNQECCLIFRQGLSSEILLRNCSLEILAQRYLLRNAYQLFLALLCSALQLCLALLSFAQLCLALLGFAQLRLALLSFAWLCLALLSFAQLCLALLSFAWLCLALLGFAQLCFAQLGLALLSFAQLCLALLGFAWLCLSGQLSCAEPGWRNQAAGAGGIPPPQLGEPCPAGHNHSPVRH